MENNKHDEAMAQLALVQADPGFKSLPAEQQKAVVELFQPPKKLLGDLTQSEKRWSPIYCKLEQKGGKNPDGSTRDIGSIYGKVEFPNPYRIAVLGFWYSRELFAPMDSDESGLLCSSPNGQVPSLRHETPRSKNCWKCPHNTVYNKRAGEKGGRYDKCRITMNLITLVLEQDPPEVFGVHVIPMHGMSYRTAVAITAELENCGDTLGRIFTMSTVEESPRKGVRYYKHVIQKVESTPEELKVILEQIQVRAIDWVNKHSTEEHLKSSPGDDTFEEGESEGSATEFDDSMLT